MFVWWTDVYTLLTISVLIWPVLALLLSLYWWKSRRAVPFRRMKWMLAAWLLLLAPWAYITASILRNNSGIDQSIAAADVTFRLADGRSVALRELRGKVVLLDFWATWCPPCRASTPALSHLADTHRDDGVVVVGVSGDEDDHAWRTYIRRHGSSRLEARDSDDGVARAFSIKGRPTFVMIDRSGVIRWRQIGWTLYSYPQMKQKLDALLR